MSNRKIDPVVFVKTWQLASCLAEAADRMGMPKFNTSVYASQLRKKGVRLKTFPKGPRGEINVDALNDLIEEL
jgi:hypothetical protein